MSCTDKPKPIGLPEWLRITTEMLMEVYPEDAFPRKLEMDAPPAAIALALVSLAADGVASLLNGHSPHLPFETRTSK